MEVEKKHRRVSFEQQPGLEPHFFRTTKQRAAAENDSMKNSTDSFIACYGTTNEKVRNRIFSEN